MNKKLMALLLALVMCTSLLAGCGSSASAPEETTPVETIDVEATPEATDSTEDDAAAKETYERYKKIYDKYDPDTVVMKVNGEDVTWSTYFYWLYSMATQFEAVYGITDWTKPFDLNSTCESYLKNYIEKYVMQFWTIKQKAVEAGITLDEEDEKEIQDGWDTAKESAGAETEEEFLDDLDSIFLPADLYRRLLSTTVYNNKLYMSYYGEMGKNLSDEDALAYAEDAGYMHAKHILVRTVDDEGNALDEETVAEKLAKVNDILAELKGVPANELEAKFDELMTLNSEDSGLAGYPDGYYFVSGEMVEQFENAVKELENGGLSEVVETGYGYHIILRLPLSPEGIVEYPDVNLRYVASASLYNNMLDEWFNESTIEYENGFDTISYNDLFDYVPENADSANAD